MKKLPIIDFKRFFIIMIVIWSIALSFAAFAASDIKWMSTNAVWHPKLEKVERYIECGTTNYQAQYSKKVSLADGVLLLKDIIPPNIELKCWSLVRFKEIGQTQLLGKDYSNIVLKQYSTLSNPNPPEITQ